MKFLATENRNIRTPRGQFVQVIKGQVYPQTVAKHFFKNGTAPAFLKKYAPSHVERYIITRTEFLKDLGFVSDVSLAVYKGLFDFHSGDSKALKAMLTGVRAKGYSLERRMIDEFNVAQHVTGGHTANDPCSDTQKLFDSVFPINAATEQAIIARVIEIESSK